ncbi:MAG: copper transporter, partial [Bifidobacteriaceae bacterium]|nr:copper transporter [Bifidobacteriaceae bacterium]
MINFRYHVVSLVSVFLALAVGIVLGAGPLKEPIETGLADQVSALRQDKDDLRSQLSDQEAISEYTAEVLEGLEGRALTSLLPGEAVLLVQLGDGQGDRMEALRAGVNRAGAKVAGQIRLEDNWAQADRLAQAGEALDGLLGVGYFGFGLDYQSKVFSALELVLAGPRVEATGDGSQWFPEVEEGGAGDADGEAADGDQGTGDGSDQAADGAGPADGDQGTGGEQTGDAGDGAGTAGDGDQTGPDQTAGPEDPDEPSAEPTGVATVAPSGTSRPSASPTPAEPDGRRADQTVLAAVWDALTDAGVFSGEQPGATTAVVLLSGAYDAGLSE